MSKKRTRDVINTSTEVEMHDSNNKSVLKKCEPAKLQNIAPVCKLFYLSCSVLGTNIEVLKFLYMITGITY